eukprot:2167687-Pleurochrysis_carterae.AAC.1
MELEDEVADQQTALRQEEFCLIKISAKKNHLHLRYLNLHDSLRISVPKLYEHVMSARVLGHALLKPRQVNACAKERLAWLTNLTICAFIASPGLPRLWAFGKGVDRCAESNRLRFALPEAGGEGHSLALPSVWRREQSCTAPHAGRLFR